jgi:hypothetical protein
MKYQKSIDIWKISDDEIKKLQRGQWIHGGKYDNKGIFLGVKPSGTIVVAWLGNMHWQKSYRGYIQALLNYAKGV